MKGFLLICATLASCVSGHMQMSKPFPIRSPLNRNAHGKVDYSYTNPLNPDGSNFPCKGYQHDPFHSVADYHPGHQYELEIEGSATHGGGSCQVSLSYDNGQSFRVIQSMLGGCPIERKYNFTIPEHAPAGKALLAWTWFNKIGNREMYMNCAQVTIKGSQEQRQHPRDLSPKLSSRANALDTLPDIFVANVHGPGLCTTIGGEQVNFPLPGPAVSGNLTGYGYKCRAHAPFLGVSPSETPSVSSPRVPDATSSPPASTSTASVVFVGPSASLSLFASPTGAASPSKVASSFGVSSTASAIPTPSASANVPSGSGSCTDGEIICAADGKSFSMCDHGAPVNMGPVAAGTLCKNQAIVHADPEAA